MSASLVAPVIPAMEGDVAIPRKNGEPVFEAPWQSRAFGMVVGLHKAGLYPWDDFKELLIDEIAAGPCVAAPPDSPEYYYQWVEAFLRLLVKKGILDKEEIETRTTQFRTGIRQEVY
jgi:nitrile hydratase accessory protein